MEEWCYGYMRGVSLTDWSALPERAKPDLDVIALHGAEEQRSWTRAERRSTSPALSVISASGAAFYDYWSANPQQPEAEKPIINGTKVGRNDPCPCGSGKKFKSCCLH